MKEATREAEPGSNGSPPPDETPAQEAERLKSELAELRSRNAKLLTQVDELKSLAVSPADEPKDLQRLHLLQIQPVRDALAFLLVLGALWLGYVLSPITIPILIALGLAYLVEPAVQFVVRKGWLSRTGAAIAVVVCAVILVLAPLVIGGAFGVAQVVRYGDHFRDRVATLRDSIENPHDVTRVQAVKKQGLLWGMTHDFIVKARESSAAPKPPAPEAAPGATGVPPATGPPAPAPTGPPPVLAADIKEEGAQTTPAEEKARRRNQPLSTQVAEMLWNFVQRSGGDLGEMFGAQVLGTGADVLRFAGKVVLGSVWAVFALFLILFFFFFFSIGMEGLSVRMSQLIPKWRRDRTVSMLHQMDAVISGFVRGRLLITAIMVVAFTAGFWVIGVPAPLILGPLAGLLALVPYASLVTIPVCWLLMWMEPGAGPEWQRNIWWVLLAPTVVYSIIQIADDYFMTPIIQGRKTDMDTPTILFAVLAGGFLMGFYGMLLAVPVAACLKILIRENFWPRFTAWADGRVKDFLPISRYDPTETGTTPAEAAVAKTEPT